MGKKIPAEPSAKNGGREFLVSGRVFSENGPNQPHCTKQDSEAEHYQKEQLAFVNNFGPRELGKSDGEKKIKDHKEPTGPDFFGPDQLDPCFEIYFSHSWTEPS